MSRYRNRNIRNKFHVPTISQEQNLTENSGIDVKPVFGEPVKPRFDTYSARRNWSRIPTLSSCDSSDIDIIEDRGDRNKDSFDKSSTSSLSWAEDYENQATEIVKKEYERMERVLQCLEPIPTHYDKDEYRLWIKTFPCLSLTSTAPEISYRRFLSTPFGTEKPEKTCDKSTSAVSRISHSTDLKTPSISVIDKLLDELYPKYNSGSNVSKQSINSTLNPRMLDIQFDSFLRISQAPINVKVPDNKKEAISRTAHWLQESNFKSLPSIEVEPKKSFGKRKKSSLKEGSSDFMVLPPIENGVNRSISASSNRVFNSNSDSLLGSYVNYSGRTRHRSEDFIQE